MARLREQERARAAREAVVGYQQEKQTDENARKEYRQELQQLPSRILASGLGQTLAFYAARQSQAQRAIGRQLAHFLMRKPGETRDLLDYIVKIEEAGEYRRLTREALAYAEWLKRYSAALIPKE